MAVSAPTMTNSELQHEVEQELKWDPSVALASVGVTANDHTIGLSGTVQTFSSRLAAVRAAKRIRGVHAISDDIVVEPLGSHGRTDHDIAVMAEEAMHRNMWVPAEVKATVREGMVTLDGTVAWDYERRAAADAVEHIAGVRNVINSIVLKSAPSSPDIHERILKALKRSAIIDASNVHVTSEGGHVTLRGSVSSWAERERAQNAAWSALGVTRVTDDLVIR